jgi:hypothetical protein
VPPLGDRCPLDVDPPVYGCNAPASAPKLLSIELRTTRLPTSSRPSSRREPKPAATIPAGLRLPRDPAPGPEGPEAVTRVTLRPTFLPALHAAPEGASLRQPSSLPGGLHRPSAPWTPTRRQAPRLQRAASAAPRPLPRRLRSTPEGVSRPRRAPLASSGPLSRHPRRGPRPVAQRPSRTPGDLRGLCPCSLPRKGARPFSGHLARSALRQAAPPEDTPKGIPLGAPSAALRPAPHPGLHGTRRSDPPPSSMPGDLDADAASATTRKQPPHQPRRFSRSATVHLRPRSDPKVLPG